VSTEPGSGSNTWLAQKKRLMPADKSNQMYKLSHFPFEVRVAAGM